MGDKNFMNERPNAYRSVPFAEVEQDHAFKTLRHFPELRQSLPAIRNCQTTQKRNFTEKCAPRKSIPREVKLKSTHRLATLAESSLGEINALTSFRRVLATERSRQREEISQTFTPIKKLTLLETANERLTKASLSFDSRCMINVLEGFQGCRELTKKQFEVQLRRCLNILLSAQEFDALFASMDVNNSMSIDAVEFTRYFFKLGNDARDVIRHKVRMIKENEVKFRKKVEMEGLERGQSQTERQVTAYTEEDATRVMQKLSLIALNWDPKSFTAKIEAGEFNAFLAPLEFKNQIECSFGLKLDAAETGALVNMFGTRAGEHCIDGYNFLKCFINKIPAKARNDDVAKRKVNEGRKKKTLAMGQHVDCLPKTLGR